MTQRDLQRLREGQEPEPIAIDLPPVPPWEDISVNIENAVPHTDQIEEDLDSIYKDLQELQKQALSKIVEAKNIISRHLREMKAVSLKQARIAKSQVESAQSRYRSLETKLHQMVDRANSERKTVVRASPPRRQSPAAKKLEPAPCWARSIEPAGKLNCGCQGAPVAYKCVHPEVGGFVTLHAASLRDSLLRKPDGTEENLGTRHLKPCSLCQHRSEVQGDAAQVTSLTLTMRTTICDNCQLKPTCGIPGTSLIKMPETACPDGRWTTEQ